MIKKGSANVLKVLLTLALIIGILHTSFHIFVYGTGIPSLYQKGVSGFAVGGVDIDSIFKQNQTISLKSFLILSGEWILVWALIITMIIRSKLDVKRELFEVAHSKRTNKGNNKTDLDVLLELLKERKKLKVSTASKIFKVNEETIIKWGEILESANLATVEYPNVGEPELKVRINEKQ